MKLFEQATLGTLKLKNKVVMAPMTRSRAIQNTPGDIMVDYYSQRASAGLIITEGASPSPNGLGYARIPGLFNTEQEKGWKKVTDGVHAKGGKIFLQIMHTGRVGHPLNMQANARILAPSALALSGKMWTDSQGEQPFPTPIAMSESDIKEAVKEYVHCAELAIQAGFDGVELHCANGYLMEQFLNPNCNKRTDSYGGSPKGLMAFPLEVASQVSKKIGSHRTGIRISPYGVFNDTGAFAGIDEFYVEFTKELNALNLVYLHVVDHSSMGAPAVSATLKRDMRAIFKGAYILSGGYNAERAEADLIENKGDLVAFGRPFIANPDLVPVMMAKMSLNEADQSKFYTPGPEGYSVYPSRT
ncbi:MAG: alkene reductase [Pseudomonadota bacterium]